MPLGRLERPVDAITIELAGQHVGQVGVPDFIRVLLQRDPLRFLARVGGVEEAQLDLGGMLREQGEIDPRTVPGGAEGVRVSRP